MSIRPVTAAAMSAARRSSISLTVLSVAVRMVSSCIEALLMWSTIARCSSMGGIGSQRFRTESCPMFCIELLVPVASRSNPYRPTGVCRTATRYCLFSVSSFTSRRYSLSHRSRRGRTSPTNTVLPSRLVVLARLINTSPKQTSYRGRGAVPSGNRLFWFGLNSQSFTHPALSTPHSSGAAGALSQMGDHPCSIPFK